MHCISASAVTSPLSNECNATSTLRSALITALQMCNTLLTECYGGGADLEDGLDAKVEGGAGALTRAQLLGDLGADLAPLQVVLQVPGVGRAQRARLVALRKLQRLPVPVRLQAAFLVSTYARAQPEGRAAKLTYEALAV